MSIRRLGLAAIVAIALASSTASAVTDDDQPCPGPHGCAVLQSIQLGLQLAAAVW